MILFYVEGAMQWRTHRALLLGECRHVRGLERQWRLARAAFLRRQEKRELEALARWVEMEERSRRAAALRALAFEEAA